MVGDLPISDTPFHVGQKVLVNLDRKDAIYELLHGAVGIVVADCSHTPLVSREDCWEVNIQGKIGTWHLVTRQLIPYNGLNVILDLLP